MSLTDAKTHERIVEKLSDAGLSIVAQEAALSCMIPDSPHISHFPSLPSDVNKAVCSFFSLTRALGKSSAAFDAAFQSNQAAWKGLERSLEGGNGLLRSEHAAAALLYGTHLAKFRELWSSLFNPTHPSSLACPIPPHMFAVSWSEVLQKNTSNWIREACDEARKTFVAIERGESPPIVFFLFILQHVFAVRVTLLECVAKIMMHSSLSVDVMVVVRYMYAAREAEKEMSDLQAIWRRLGVLPDAIFSNDALFCSNSLDFFGTFLNSCGFDHFGLKIREKSFPRCLFFWSLRHFVCALYGRLSLLFGGCFVGLPFNSLCQGVIRKEEGIDVVDSRVLNPCARSLDVLGSVSSHSLPKVPPSKRTTTTTQSTLVRTSTRDTIPRGGNSSCLSGESSLHLGKQEEGGEREETSLAASSDELQSPFQLTFTCNDTDEREFLDKCDCHLLSESLFTAVHEHPHATILLISDCTSRPGKRAWQSNRYTLMTCADDATSRQGLEHWVLNFVYPFLRLSKDPERRSWQESLLLRTVVFRLAGSLERRMRFTNVGSVFYTLRSESNMDEGRLYFVLLLQRRGPATAAGEEDAEESRWAFSTLERLCSTWSMSQLCNVAVRAGTWDAQTRDHRPAQF